MEKAKIRFNKYAVWALVNFIICLLPIVISGLMSKKIDDTIISSYVSYSYTLLISSLYVYKSFGKDHELLFWITFLVSTILLVAYIFFPNLLSVSVNQYVRENFLLISLIILGVVIVLSLILNFRSIEDQVEKLFNESVKKRADKTENNVKGYFDQLKGEQQ